MAGETTSTTTTPEQQGQPAEQQGKKQEAAPAAAQQPAPEKKPEPQPAQPDPEKAKAERKAAAEAAARSTPALESTAVDPRALPFGMLADSSPEVAQLFAALAKAQGAMATAAKDRANPHFGSKYADLASVWEACREALAAYGLAVVQQARSKGPHVAVRTVLGHASGQWITCELIMSAQVSTPQAIGSAITYARRYGLASMVGVAAAEDDDGEAAHGRGDFNTRAPEQQPRQQQQRRPPAEKKQAPAEKKPEAPVEKAPAEPHTVAVQEGAPSAFEQLQIVLEECSTTEDCSGWLDQKNAAEKEGAITPEQLAQLRTDYTTKVKKIRARA